MRILRMLCILLALIVAPISAVGEGGTEKFHGYWAPVDEEFWCDLTRDEWGMEGAQIIIGPNEILFGDMGTCEDVGQWMKGDRMRVSAACRHEGGAISINGEFWFDQEGVLFNKLSGMERDGDRGFKRCPNL